MASISGAARQRIKHLVVLAAVGAGLGAVLMPAAAYATVNATVSSSAVRLTAVCPGAAGTTFTVIGPDDKSFTVSTPNSNTSGFPTAGHVRGTYSFTGVCADGTAAGSGTFVLAPTGGPTGGDGGRTETVGALVAGIVLLGAATGGGILLRRRGRVPR